jgi:thiol-disulfide isomerase/thioredoxin
MRLALAVILMAGVLPAQSKLTLLNQESYPKLVASHKGKILLVDFWATWCVPCRAEMPKLVKLSDGLRAKGLDFVTVSADEADKEQAAYKFLMQNGVGAPFFWAKLTDAEKEKFYDSVDTKWSGEMPAIFIYDRFGKRVKSFLGETPTKDIEAAIQKMLP